MLRLLPVLLLCPALVLGAEPDVARLLDAARRGDAYAQLNVGAAYDQGIGVAADPISAEHWYRRAAAQGVPEAQFNLGHLLVTGGSNLAEGAAWLRAAAEQGVTDAQYLVGVIYTEGMGVPRDETVARRWLQRAAEQGHEEAQAFLGASFADPATE